MLLNTTNITTNGTIHASSIKQYRQGGHVGPHLLLAHIIQSLNKGLLSVLGGRSALQTKIMIKYIK
jgi:hypothetical protein